MKKLVVIFHLLFPLIMQSMDFSLFDINSTLENSQDHGTTGNQVPDFF